METTKGLNVGSCCENNTCFNGSSLHSGNLRSFVLFGELDNGLLKPFRMDFAILRSIITREWEGVSEYLDLPKWAIEQIQGGPRLQKVEGKYDQQRA